MGVCQYAMMIFYDERYKKLQNKNHLLGNCLDSVPSLFVILDKDWKVVFANDIFQAFSIGKNLTSFDDVLECCGESAELCEVLKSGKEKLETESHFCQNVSIDENKSWRIYMGLIKKSHKNFYVCYICDIQEAPLREKDLQNIYNDLPEGICVYNHKDFSYISNNLSVTLKSNNINTQLLLEDVKNSSHKKVFFVYYKTDKDKIIFKFEKIKDGESVVYRVLTNENIIKNISIYNDDNSIMGTILVDNDLNIIDSNNKFNTLVGSYFVKKTTFLQYIDGSQQGLLKQYLKEKITRDTPPLSVNLGSGNLVLLYAENLDNNGWVLFMQDNNTQKDLESQLLHSQRLGLLGQVLSAVSHDFNNILTAIGGFCDMLCSKIPIMDEKYFAVIQIKHNVNRAVNLVKYILYLSKKNIPTCDVDTNVHDTISHLLSNMGRLLGENIAIKFIKSEKDILAKIPSINFEQILLNLIVNARDAMKNGGTITISTNLIQDLTVLRENNHEALDNTQYLELSITDTGEGISDKNKKKIFDSFFTTKKEGTGLGLSTIQSIVKQYKGFIQVESKLNVGSKFTIYLSAFEAIEKDQILNNNLPGKNAQKNMNVILVEDDISIRNLLKEGLKKKNSLNVQAFKYIKECLEYINKCILEGQSIDLVISDIMIVDGNGLELVDKILSLSPKTKFILISGYDKEHLETLNNYDVLQRHNQDIVFLQKPFSIHEISVLIDNFYNK
jgi:signal transduction histidine kinase/CheY-like chemotaxis protein